VTSESNNLFLFLEMLVRKKRFILGFILTITVIAIAVSFLLPVWYKATALVLPSSGDSMPVGKYAQLSQLSSLTSGLELPAMVTPADVHARVLRSNVIADQIIDRFDLMRRYKSERRAEAYETLKDRAVFAATDEGLLTISVEDREPQVASDMANAFVEELNKVSRELIVGKAREKRIFVEERLAAIKGELDSARYLLQAFQQDNRTVDFDEQTKLALDQAVSMKIELASLEVQIQMDERIYGSNHPSLMENKGRQALIRSQLNRLEHGGSDSSYFALPLASVPSLKGRYEFLLSRVRVSEALYEVLLEQHEQAKIQEAEAIPFVSIIDKAQVPELKSRPQRTFIVVISAGLAVIMAIILASVITFLENLSQRNNDDYQRVQSFFRAYLGWLPGFKGHNR